MATPNATAEKFGHPASLIREYRHWLVLARPQQATLGALVLVCTDEAKAFSQISVRAFEERIQAMLQDILRQGRESEEFERKTPLDETAAAIQLVMRPYLNPLLLQYNFDYAEHAPAQLSSLVLRSLSP